MNKNFISALALLLKMKIEDVQTAIEKVDGDDSVIKEFTTKHEILTADDLAKKIKNSNKAYLDNADFDINEVPAPLYGKIKKAALEKLEKDIAAKHGVIEYKGLEELVDKITAKYKEGKITEEVQRQLDTLKQSVLDGEKKYTDLVEKNESDKVTGEFNNSLLDTPLDYENEKVEGKRSVLETQQNLLKAAFNQEYKVVKKGETIVVTGADGKTIVDKLGEPMKVSDVLKSFATENGFKLKTADPGGRGASSSSDTGGVKGIPFGDYLAKKGIKQNTPESDDAYIEWEKSNK